MTYELRENKGQWVEGFEALKEFKIKNSNEMVINISGAKLPLVDEYSIYTSDLLPQENLGNVGDIWITPYQVFFKFDKGWLRLYELYSIFRYGYDVAISMNGVLNFDFGSVFYNDDFSDISKRVKKYSSYKEYDIRNYNEIFIFVDNFGQIKFNEMLKGYKPLYYIYKAEETKDKIIYEYYDFSKINGNFSEEIFKKEYIPNNLKQLDYFKISDIAYDFVVNRKILKKIDEIERIKNPFNTSDPDLLFKVYNVNENYKKFLSKDKYDKLLDLNDYLNKIKGTTTSFNVLMTLLDIQLDVEKWYESSNSFLGEKYPNNFVLGTSKLYDDLKPGDMILSTEVGEDQDLSVKSIISLKDLIMDITDICTRLKDLNISSKFSDYVAYRDYLTVYNEEISFKEFLELKEIVSYEDKEKIYNNYGFFSGGRLGDFILGSNGLNIDRNIATFEDNILYHYDMDTKENVSNSDEITYIDYPFLPPLYLLNKQPLGDLTKNVEKYDWTDDVKFNDNFKILNALGVGFTLNESELGKITEAGVITEKYLNFDLESTFKDDKPAKFVSIDYYEDVKFTDYPYRLPLFILNESDLGNDKSYEDFEVIDEVKATDKYNIYKTLGSYVLGSTSTLETTTGLKEIGVNYSDVISFNENFETLHENRVVIQEDIRFKDYAYKLPLFILQKYNLGDEKSYETTSYNDEISFKDDYPINYVVGSISLGDTALLGSNGLTDHKADYIDYMSFMEDYKVDETHKFEEDVKFTDYPYRLYTILGITQLDDSKHYEDTFYNDEVLLNEKFNKNTNFGSMVLGEDSLGSNVEDINDIELSNETTTKSYDTLSDVQENNTTEDDLKFKDYAYKLPLSILNESELGKEKNYESNQDDIEDLPADSHDSDDVNLHYEIYDEDGNLVEEGDD